MLDVEEIHDTNEKSPPAPYHHHTQTRTKQTKLETKLGVQVDYMNTLDFNSLLKRFFQHLKSCTEV